MDSSEISVDNIRQTAEAQLEEGKQLFQQGDKAGAEALFKRIVQTAPYFEDAWLWLAYVAPTDGQRLSLLREATLFIPGSERIAQAQAWAREQYAAHAGDDAEALDDTPPTERPLGARRKPKSPRRKAARSVADELDGVAREAGRNVRNGWEDAREWTAQAVSGATNRLGGVGVYLVSVLGIAAIVFLVFTSLSRATKAPITVSPMVLPTRVIDATPTPTTASRVDQEWVKVEVAWTKSDWNSAIRSLDSILQMSPDDEQATGQLADALLQRALDSVEANDLEAAKADLDRAIKCDASKVEVRQVRSDLEGYLEGVRYYQAQQWQLAVDALTEVYAEAAGFRDTASLLADSYRELGSEALESQDWYGAQEQFEACLSYEPANQSCLKDLDEVASIITPPTRIEVSLITRICDVYEDGEIIKTFQVCTGRPSSPTVAGRYEILDKIEEGAYASAWDLDMPYWMGIYWAGGSENGFHAYPLRGGSQVLWQGSLGTGCSFGCIVLDTYDAEWLYNWAEIGTVVFVRD